MLSFCLQKLRQQRTEIVVCVITDMKMAHRLTSLPVVLVVVFMTSTKGDEILNNTRSERSQCKLLCIPFYQLEPFFHTPQEGFLTMTVKKCNVTSLADHCDISLDTLLNDVIKAQGEPSTAQLYVVLFCNTNSTNASPRVTLVNNGSISAKHLISYLHVFSCKFSLSDIAAYGQATDFRVLTLMDWNEVLSDQSHGSRNNQSVNDTPTPLDIPGLDNIGTLNVAHTKPMRKGIPRAFIDYVWPRMAEVDLRNLSMTDEDLHGLEKSMPLLQSLQCDFNNLTTPPVFPWYQVPLKLPRNLSRTVSANQHYAHANGIYIKPNIYRRTFGLTDNNVDLTQWKFQGSLDAIVLTHNGLDRIGPDCFKNVTDLQSLKLSYNKLVSLPESLFDGMDSLRELHLGHNQLVSITMRHFTGLTNLKKLYINNNLLTSLGQYVFLPMADLELIDVSSNHLTSISREAVGVNMRFLAVVRFSRNNLTHLPEWIFTTRTLRDIDVSFNSISFETLLESIDHMEASVIVGQNRESASTFNFLYKPLYVKLVNLKHNNFTRLDYNLVNSLIRLQGFRAIVNFFQLNIEENDINCDCKTYSMYKFFREERSRPDSGDYSVPAVGPYYFDSWKCMRPASVHGKAIVEVSNRTFMCKEDLKDCPSSCECLVRTVDGSISVNCSNKNMIELPAILPNHTETLLFQNNSLVALSGSQRYLGNLKILDVSDNKITQIDENSVSVLKRLKHFYIHNNRLTTLPKSVKKAWDFKATLSGNLFRCDCHAPWLQKWMYTRRYSIVDVDNVLCASGKPQGQILIMADLDDFVCQVSHEVIKTVAVTLGVLLGLLLIISLPVYRFRGEIKVLIYLHLKWHPFDKSDDSDIIEKLYDAFVSYSGYDYDWVVHTLRPMLETEETPYRLCLHDRDFMCGAAIQDNILNSVKYSRRMILLVTERFLQSEWCLLEFRAAHERVLRDRTNYLIVVLFDDINVDDLDEDLKLYLRTNTYLSISNKWFWQKLLYAMPEKPLAKLRGEQLPAGGFRTLLPMPESLPNLKRSSAKNPAKIEEWKLTEIVGEAEEDAETPAPPSRPSNPLEEGRGNEHHQIELSIMDSDTETLPPKTSPRGKLPHNVSVESDDSGIVQ